MAVPIVLALPTGAIAGGIECCSAAAGRVVRLWHDTTTTTNICYLRNGLLLN